MKTPKATGYYDARGKPCEADSPERVVTEWNGAFRTRSDGKPALVLVEGKWVAP
jgi:hypothetical protein